MARSFSIFEERASVEPARQLEDRSAKGDSDQVLRPIISFLLFLGALLGVTHLATQEIPRVDRSQGSAQLIVGGRPFIIFGGELGNSATGTAAQADEILPRVAHSHINTVLMPVAWEQIERLEESSTLLFWIIGSSKREFSICALSCCGSAAGRMPSQ